jgi:DNA-binding transcriptional ArsR family regulator
MLLFFRRTSKEVTMAHNPRPALIHPQLSSIPVTAVMHALSDDTRLAIVQILQAEEDGRACGTFPVDVAPSTLSHHFKVLREAGLIEQENRGTQRWTTLRAADLQDRFPGLLDAITTAAAGDSTRQ